jgi:hypothetical protein
MNLIPRIQRGLPKPTYHIDALWVYQYAMYGQRTGYKLFKFVASNSIENESKNVKFYDSRLKEMCWQCVNRKQNNNIYSMY